jgi:Flp pilus assembly CpaF family ATPase
MPTGDRVVLIEDTRELQCAAPDLVALRTKDGAASLAEAVYSADVILNILARRRDPVAPITILTPPALRLQYEPVADCARYDNLRRAG